MTELETFKQAFFEALYFTDTGEDDQPPQEADLSPELRDRCEDECERFFARSGLAGVYGKQAIELAGHDFWLTRNGHGAGFWDGDWHEPKATYLTALSDEFGPVETYLGDDGMIYA